MPVFIEQEAATVVLSGDGHLGKTYELAGDESYTLKELAAEVSKQVGKEIPYTNLPEGEYAKVLASAGVPEQCAQAIAQWDAGASRNDLFDDNKVLSKLIGRPTTPLSVSVKNALEHLS